MISDPSCVLSLSVFPCRHHLRHLSEKTGGGLPDGLPPIEAVVSDKAVKLLAMARKSTTRKMAYAEGNRNNYVHLSPAITPGRMPVR